jgi:hypothetical protein
VAQKSIDEAAKAKQILQRTDQRKVWRKAGGGFEIRPFSGDQRLTAVRQNQNELQTATHECVSEDVQRLSFEGVMRTGDRYPFWEVPMVGSVWWSPSTTSITTF